MPQALVIRDARQLAEAARLAGILRLSQQKLLLQGEAARYQAEELKAIISRAKARSGDDLQTWSWHLTLQRSSFASLCTIENSFFDSQNDRLAVRLHVYKRAMALYSSGTPSLDAICRAASLDIPYRSAGSNPHCVSSALREGGGVCQAIALYVCQLLLRCGYPCVVRTGSVNGLPHAWNQVMYHGQWHTLDLCVNGPAVYQEDPAFLPPSEQYRDMCGTLSKEVVLLERESVVNGVKVPFFIADRCYVCPTRFVQCFDGAFEWEDGQLLLCLGPAVKRLPTAWLHETPSHLPYVETAKFARLLGLHYANDRLMFTEGL